MKWTWYQSVPSSEKNADDDEVLLSTRPRFSPQLHIANLSRWLLVPAIILLEVTHIMIIFIAAKHYISERQPTPSVRPSRTNDALEALNTLSIYNTPSVLGDFDASYVVRTPDNDKLWQDLGPTDGGIVRISSIDADAYGLPESGTLEPLFPQDSLYQLTVFHQLHCLIRIRDTLLPTRDHESDGLTEVHVSNHTLHCVDYLRQTLVCNADTMLDPLPLPGSGFIITKTCRNWQAVRTWWEDNKFENLDDFWELRGFVVKPPA